MFIGGMIPINTPIIKLTQQLKKGSLNRWISPYKVNNKQLRGGYVYIGEVGPFLIGGDIGAHLGVVELVELYPHARDEALERLFKLVNSFFSLMHI